MSYYKHVNRININEHHYMNIIMNQYIYIHIQIHTLYYVTLYHSMLYHSPYKLYNYGHILAGNPPWLLFRRQVSCESPGTFGIPGTVFTKPRHWGPKGLGLIQFQWIGLRENLQETMLFSPKYRVFL